MNLRPLWRRPCGRCFWICSKSTRRFSTDRQDTRQAGKNFCFGGLLPDGADAVNGVPLEKSVEKASHFVCTCVERAIDMDLPRTDGLPIEEELRNLR